MEGDCKNVCQIGVADHRNSSAQRYVQKNLDFSNKVYYITYYEVIEMTTIRLNEDIDTKLTLLKEVEKTTKTEIIKKAIVEYYEQHIQKKTPYEIGKSLFGRYGSESDLSQSYKAKLKDKLNAKYSH